VLIEWDVRDRAWERRKTTLSLSLSFVIFLQRAGSLPLLLVLLQFNVGF